MSTLAQLIAELPERRPNMLQATERDPWPHDHQVWACMKCGNERQWGFNRPWDAMAKPVLRCQPCCQPQPHYYARVGRARKDR